MCHFHIETFFKVGLPFGIIRVGCTLDFDVPFDGDTFCLEQSNGLESPFLSKDFAMKDPILPFDGGEVFLLDPFDGFLWVSPFGPLPQDTKDCVIHLCVGFLADHVPVIIRPSANLGIQLGNEIASGGLLVLSDDFSYAF